MKHELKTWPGPFFDIAVGRKTCEFRRADRPFAFCDELVLREWSPGSECYTGKSISVYVTHVLEHSDGFGVPEGYVCMSISLVPVRCPLCGVVYVTKHMPEGTIILLSCGCL